MKVCNNFSIVTAVVLTALFSSGCGYGEVSPEAYDYATALYSICSRKDNERLSEFSEQLVTANEASKISDQELEWLKQIVDEAEQGDWEKAMKACRRIMSDQVEY